MGKFEGYLIASDFDGTFAGSDGEIPEINIEKIKYFISEGGRFTVSTGRTFQGFHKYDPAYINAPVLLCNGVCAYDYERGIKVFDLGMGADALDAADMIHAKYPLAAIEVYPFGRTYVYSPNEKTDRHLLGQDIDFKVIENGSAVETPVMKMMLNAEHEVLSDICSGILCDFPDISYIRGFRNWLEVVRCGADKGTGIHRLGDSLGIAGDKLIAVGDGYNDVDMLSAVKLSFAPLSGCEEAKNSAAYTVCSNDEGCIAGVIDFLENNICI